MKKTIYIIAFTLVALATKAQVTFEHTYSVSGSTLGIPTDFRLVNLSVSGYKYCLFDEAVKQVKIYNLNHSLWKTINIPFSSPYGRIGTNPIVSEQLFNSDNLVEVMYGSYYFPHHNYDSLFVINENGTMIFSSIALNGIAQVESDGTNFKLIIPDTTTTSVFVYGLSGTLPCNQCGGFTGIAEPNSNGSKQIISNPFPNPTNDKTTISYELPEGINQGKLVFYDVTGNIVKEFNVDSTFKDLQVSNSDLTSGTYYYQLQTSKGTSGGKKLIIIK